MPFIEINNLKVYYEVHGKGDPLFFFHHGFGSTAMWKKIFPKFIMFGYTVILYDKRGFGKSEAGSEFKKFYEDDGYRDACVRELRTLKEALGIGKCHMLGQCEGGVIVCDYAAEYPDEVITLCAASTQCFSDKTMADFNRKKFTNNFADLEPVIKAKMIEFQGDNAEERYNQFAMYGGAYGIDYFDLRPVLKCVQCPALVLYPDRSALFDVEQAVAFYRALPKGELCILPRCGHNTYEQLPDDYIRTVQNFLFRHTKGKGENIRTDNTCLA